MSYQTWELFFFFSGLRTLKGLFSKHVLELYIIINHYFRFYVRSYYYRKTISWPYNNYSWKCTSIFKFITEIFFCENFLGGSGVKNLPTKQEMRVQSLNQEDPLEKKMTTHFYILAWKSHGQSLAGYNPQGHKNDRHNLANKQQQQF